MPPEPDPVPDAVPDPVPDPAPDPAPDPVPDLVLRPAGPADLPAVAELHLRAREAAYPAMPRGVHPPAEVRAWVTGWDLGRREVWLAESAAGPVGYAALEADWLDALYVAPEAVGQGVGSALLELVKQQRPDGFGLCVFESNEPARRFYRRHGLVELERTDGSDNEEGAPDVRVVWPGPAPLRFLRSMIDEVDAQLGELLARRVALTRAVQGHKPDTARDPAREREIVDRVARLVPELGPERTARVVHTIIEESLAAARTGADG